MCEHVCLAGIFRLFSLTSAVLHPGSWRNVELKILLMMFIIKAKTKLDQSLTIMTGNIITQQSSSVRTGHTADSLLIAVTITGHTFTN